MCGPEDSVEVWPNGRLVVHQRSGLERDFEVIARFFTNPELQRPHLTAGTVLPVEGPLYDYSDKRKENRKKINRAHRGAEATGMGVAVMIAKERPEGSLCERHLHKYMLYVLKNGTEVYTAVDNWKKILMVKRPGEDYEYIPQ